jgi:uncharacterized protein (DUF302 family)
MVRSRLDSSKKGIVQVKSEGSFGDTFERLESAVTSRGLVIFARIDFSGDAERLGLAMRPTRLLVFGSPKAGTPLMIAAPTLAIDLPLKVLASEDEEGRTSLSYNSPEYLRERHGIPEGMLGNISGAAAIVESAARVAADAVL